MTDQVIPAPVHDTNEALQEQYMTLGKLKAKVDALIAQGIDVNTFVSVGGWVPENYLCDRVKYDEDYGFIVVGYDDHDGIEHLFDVEAKW